MNEIKISVVIATRNRPEQFLNALKSVLRQSYTNIEVIVVNDGSDAKNLSQYRAIERKADGRVIFIYLPLRPNGHGPSFARNTAASRAQGKFLAFLDDDDEWTDENHLARFISTLGLNKKLDLYLSNQVAIYSDGLKATRPIWLENLSDLMHEQKKATDTSVIAEVWWLLKGHGFAHLNCIIVKLSIFKEVLGFDEALRYEEDKDLYWRLLDKAHLILYDKHQVAKHNIPSKGLSASSLFNELTKLQFQLQIAEKNLLSSRSNFISKKCINSVHEANKKISLILWKNEERSFAKYYIKKSLAAKFSIKWFIFLNYIRVVNIVR